MSIKFVLLIVIYVFNGINGINELASSVQW